MLILKSRDGCAGIALGGPRFKRSDEGHRDAA